MLAVIPARGGSKGIPGKNIKMIAGKPLIAYTILAARGSKYIDDVIVSTDSSEIAVVSGTFGAEVPFMRPESISGDRSKSIEAEVHAVEWLKERGREYDAVVYLTADQPFAQIGRDRWRCRGILFAWRVGTRFRVSCIGESGSDAENGRLGRATSTAPNFQYGQKAGYA